MVMDISEQKYPEETTQHPSRLPEIVAAISGRLTDLSTEQRDEGIRWALAQVGQYAAAEHGCVHRLVNNGTAFDCAHYWHADDTSAAVYPLRGVAVDSGRWPLSRILADQNVLIPSARSLPAECAAEQREMQRLGLGSVRAAVHDLDEPLAAALAGPYDRVLVDAPCSGLGVLRRNPDTKWRVATDAPARCGRRQLRFLRQLAPAVKPGGVLVYAVCSTEPEENERVVAAFLDTHPGFSPDDCRAALPQGARQLVGPDGWLHCYPHRQDTDGFFVARLRRGAGG